MKNTNFKNTLTILMLFISVASFSQTQAFIGTWENHTGNSIFRVIISPNTSGHVATAPLMGRYFKVNINNGTETIIYSSDLVPVGNFQWEPGFYASNNEGSISSISGSLIDHTYLDSTKFKWGAFSITIYTISCLTCPLTANWEVVRPSGLRLDSEPLEYNIPTNIVLTKQ
jgi:hypothetical protein